MATDRLMGRNGEVWRAYLRGETQESIGARVGVSQTRVSQIIADARQAIPLQTREEQAAQSAELLRELRCLAMELVDAPPVPAYSNGRPILLEDGSPAYDHTGRLTAMRAVLDIEKRAAQLMGLDAVTKTELSVSGMETTAAQNVASDAAERLARARGEES